MKTLVSLLKEVEYSGTAPLDAEVTMVVMDSRKVTVGSVFVCVKGKHFDGHDAAEKALEQGAVAVITARKLGLSAELTVADTRAVYAKLCQNFFDNPQKRLTLIAVTGTNGKTTVSSVIKQALCSMDIMTGLIGTIRCEIGDTILPAKFTTPESWDTCALFSRMLAAGCTHVVMEASSQALDQGRLIGLNFACSVFTNLTQDHLDWHGTMENYYQAKKSLFAQSKHAVINIDDPYGRRLAEELEGQKTTISAESDSADFTAKSIEYAITGVRFAVNGIGYLKRLTFAMPGLYSVNNAMCAVCALFALDIDKDRACDAISKTKGVKGRCEVLYSGDFTVICDFAHTGDGLQQLLSSLKPFVQGRLVVLFGCAGDRDPKKRPAMAEAVCRYADFIILSSDNPRTEDPMKIIDEVAPHIQKNNVAYTAIPDRFYAIQWAIKNSRPDDVLVLCGKGHEDYQVIDGCTIYLDEHQIVAEMTKDL